MSNSSTEITSENTSDTAQLTSYDEASTSNYALLNQTSDIQAMLWS